MKETFGYQDFMDRIDKVQRVEIKQNAEIPTGIVTAFF